MYRMLGVTRSGYYDWRGRAPTVRTTANLTLLGDVRRLQARHQGRYGSLRMHAALRASMRPRRRRAAFQPSDPAMKLDTPLTQPGVLTVEKKVDPAAPIVLAANEAALVIAFRRVEPAAKGRSSAIGLLRYDPVQRDIIYRPKDWKKLGDKTTYAQYIQSHDKKLPYEVQVVRLTPGSYVINAMAVGTETATTTNCFGAPTFSLAAGEVAYLGDFVPYMGLELADGEKLPQLIYATHFDDARQALATVQPALASAMKPAVVQNGATYACSGITMTRWDIVGANTVPAPPSATVIPAASN